MVWIYSIIFKGLLINSEKNLVFQRLWKDDSQ